ncbi:MAG: hypothetical protein ACRCRT_06100 [Cetobacterium somerae]
MNILYEFSHFGNWTTRMYTDVSLTEIEFSKKWRDNENNILSLKFGDYNHEFRTKSEIEAKDFLKIYKKLKSCIDVQYWTPDDIDSMIEIVLDIKKAESR